MPMDPHHIEQLAGPQFAVFWLQKEVTRNQVRGMVKPSSPEKSEVAGEANKCQQILVSSFTGGPHETTDQDAKT